MGSGWAERGSDMAGRRTVQNWEEGSSHCFSSPNFLKESKWLRNVAIKTVYYIRQLGV